MPRRPMTTLSVYPETRQNLNTAALTLSAAIGKRVTVDGVIQVLLTIGTENPDILANTAKRTLITTGEND